MSGNNKLFKFWYGGEYKFTHAANAKQAAIAFANSLKLSFVDPAKVYEVKQLKLYRGFKINSYGNAYGYCFIAAYSFKQALFFGRNAYGFRSFELDGSSKETSPGTALGDVIDDDWNSYSVGKTIANINYNK